MTAVNGAAHPIMTLAQYATAIAKKKLIQSKHHQKPETPTPRWIL